MGAAHVSIRKIRGGANLFGNRGTRLFISSRNILVVGIRFAFRLICQTKAIDKILRVAK
jgi:hypothetical protein